MDPKSLVSPHLDLYRYWDAKRGSRQTPTRRDVDPTEIGLLLRHIALVEAYHAGYRWRLMGTKIVADIGRDLTGQTFGEHFGQSAFVDALTSTFDFVLAWGAPIFEENLYETAFGTIHAVSRLLLPLSGGGSSPAMVMLTRVIRSLREEERDSNYLKTAAGTVVATFDIGSLGALEERALKWEGTLLPTPARAGPPPVTRVGGLWGGGLMLPVAMRC